MASSDGEPTRIEKGFDREHYSWNAMLPSVKLGISWQLGPTTIDFQYLGQKVRVEIRNKIL